MIIPVLCSSATLGRNDHHVVVHPSPQPVVRHRATPAPPVVREKARARPSPAHSQFAVEDETIHNPAEVQNLIDRYLNTRGAPDHLDPGL